MKRREGILLLVILVAAGIYLIVDDTPLPPSADAQEPVAVACLKRAGFDVKSESYAGARDIHYRLDVDETGDHVALVYLADLPEDIDLFVDGLKDDQKTYGDYKGEKIEQRGTAAIRLAKGTTRAGAIHDCVDEAAKAKET